MRSYMLDDVIAALEAGKTVNELIANRIMHMSGLVFPKEKPDLERLLRRYFGPYVDIPNPYQDFINIFRSAYADAPNSPIFVQLIHPQEKTSNKMRAGTIAPGTEWTDTMQWQNVDIPQPTERFLSDEQLTSLRMKPFGYVGTKKPTVQDFLACLFPFYDGASANLCLMTFPDDSIRLNQVQLKPYHLSPGEK